MMDVKFTWDLASEEKNAIMSKMKTIFDLGIPLPKADQFIFKSPTFSDDQCKSGTKWYLELTSGKEHYVQVNLCLADVEKIADLHVNYTLVFKTNQERASFQSKEVLDSKKFCKVRCPEKFLNANYFMALASGNFNLGFVCNLQIEVVPRTNNIFNSVQIDYEKLLSDTKYSDFMLVTSAKKFNVHKSILAVRSEFFAAMFEHEMKEMKDGFVQIKEFDDEVVQEFLRFIYCGKVENLDKLAQDLLVAAEKYLIFDLKVLCLEEICKNISIENAMELLKLVDNYNVEHLRSTVIDFIVKNIKDSTIKSNLNTIENVKISNEILRKTIIEYL